VYETRLSRAESEGSEVKTRTPKAAGMQYLAEMSWRLVRNVCATETNGAVGALLR